ncbi:MAG: chemotaxis protein CheX [Verrucomicrobiota bacterium]|nr:chemotaxis protein CheX [Verrucomicrobiota bacterium]
MTVTGESLLASVGLAGEIQGVVCFHLSSKTAAAFTARMLQIEDPASIPHADVIDATGEIANMIAGNFKSQLANWNLKTNLTIPSILTGHEMEMEETRYSYNHSYTFTNSDANETFSIKILLRKST